MGKKDTAAAAVSASEVAVMALRPELQAVLATFTEKEQAEILAQPIEDQIAELEMIFSLQNSVAIGGDVALVSAKPEQDNMLILTPGGRGLRAGTTIRGFLMGTVHVFSKTVKENWKEFKTEKALYFYNSYFKLKDADGREFGIWRSPMLNPLEKVFTNAATPSLVEKNPLVQIKYIGKIEGKEVLKQQYNLELTKGNAAHVFEVQVEEGAKRGVYVKGIVNSLNSPTPIETDSDATTVSREEATRSNYERLMALQNGGQPDAVALLQQ